MYAFRPVDPQLSATSIQQWVSSQNLLILTSSKNYSCLLNTWKCMNINFIPTSYCVWTMKQISPQMFKIVLAVCHAFDVIACKYKWLLNSGTDISFSRQAFSWCRFPLLLIMISFNDSIISHLLIDWTIERWLVWCLRRGLSCIFGRYAFSLKNCTGLVADCSYVCSLFCRIPMYLVNFLICLRHLCLQRNTWSIYSLSFCALFIISDRWFEKVVWHVSVSALILVLNTSLCKMTLLFIKSIIFLWFCYLDVFLNGDSIGAMCSVQREQAATSQIFPSFWMKSNFSWQSTTLWSIVLRSCKWFCLQLRHKSIWHDTQKYSVSSRHLEHWRTLNWVLFMSIRLLVYPSVELFG